MTIPVGDMEAGKFLVWKEMAFVVDFFPVSEVSLFSHQWCQGHPSVS